MPSLLVTGGAGFIGSNFVHYWLREHPGDRVVVLDALTYAGHLENLRAAEGRSELRFVHGNICDGVLVEKLLREERIDTLVHFAAESHVDRSIQGPDAFIQTNVVGTHALLKAARQVWLEERSVGVHRFHNVSTEEVYGSLVPDEPAFHEQSPYAPNSPYSASKAAADQLVRAYHYTYGLQVTTSLCSNNYGPYHFPEKLIPLTILNILLGRALPVYGDGRHVREWLHVEDHCQGIDLVLQKGAVGEAYNIGSGLELENLRMVQLLCEVAEQAFRRDNSLRLKYPASPMARGEPAPSLIRMVRDRPGHDRRYATNFSKIARELGYQPRVALEQGMHATFDWYLQNEWWWRSVMDERYEQWIHAHYSQ